MSNDALGGGGLDPSKFSMDGSTPSQFTMPGGAMPDYQGVQMMPAALGGVQGVQDAQDWTQAIKDSREGPNWAGLAGLKAPDTPAPLRGGASAGRGGAVDFNPQQLNMQTQAVGSMPNPGASPGSLQGNLLQLLAQGNKGFALR